MRSSFTYPTVSGSSQLLLTAKRSVGQQKHTLHKRFQVYLFVAFTHQLLRANFPGALASSVRVCVCVCVDAHSQCSHLFAWVLHSGMVVLISICVCKVYTCGLLLHVYYAYTGTPACTYICIGIYVCACLYLFIRIVCVDRLPVHVTCGGMYMSSPKKSSVASREKDRLLLRPSTRLLKPARSASISSGGK